MSNLTSDLTSRLAQSDVVTIEQLAAATGFTVEEVRTRLAATPDTEYDEQGRIIGQGRPRSTRRRPQR